MVTMASVCCFDCVLISFVEETLRLWPPIGVLPRVCEKNYQVDEVVIEAGTPVWIPVYAIHHDPAIYPNPKSFDPDRFSPAEEAKRHPFAFIPFGEGM